MGEMTEQDYREFIPDDDVEATHGLVNEPMPKGRYLLTVAKVEATDKTKGGIPRVRLRLRSLDTATRAEFGPPAFVELYLGAGKDKYENGVKVGEKSAEEYEKSKRGAQGRVLGFMKSIGVSKGTPGAGFDGIFDFYNVRSWEGRTFVGQINVRDDRNDLQNFYPVDDAKHGITSVKAPVAKGGAAPTAAPVL